MKFERIAPEAGRVLRDHTDGFSLIPNDGRDVILDRVFKKRIADGDARIIKPAKAQPAEPVKSDKK